jgi:Phasin protein
MQASSQTAQGAAQMSPFLFPDGEKLALAAARLQAQTFKAIMGYQIEMLTFLTHRCEEDVKFVDELVGCDEPSRRFDVVSSFVQTTASDYANEATKVASISSKLASEQSKRARKEAAAAE